MASRLLDSWTRTYRRLVTMYILAHNLCGRVGLEFPVALGLSSRSVFVVLSVGPRHAVTIRTLIVRGSALYPPALSGLAGPFSIFHHLDSSICI